VTEEFPDLTPDQLEVFQAQLTLACVQILAKLGVNGSGAGFNVYREIQDAAQRAHKREDAIL
jgi:hypothetical protein